MVIKGVQDLYYAIITEDVNGYETYSKPKGLTNAGGEPIKIDVSPNTADGKLFGGNRLVEIVREMSGGTVSMEITALTPEVAIDLFGLRRSTNGILAYSAEDPAPFVGIGFRALGSKGQFRYVWIYKVKFGQPAINMATKTDSITFQTPTVSGDMVQLTKADADGRHLWRIEADNDDTNVKKEVFENWFEDVPFDLEFAPENPEVDPDSRRTIIKDKQTMGKGI